LKPTDLVLTRQGLRFRGWVFPCTIGQAGVSATKREGDRATPVGKHRIVGMLFRPDRMARPSPLARPIRPLDGWSDDPLDPAYNHLVRRPRAFSHESLFRADPLYDLVLLTGWNWPEGVPGAGSAIFLHNWRRPGYPTAGCVALKLAHLRWIASRLHCNSMLIVRANLAD